MPIRINLLAEQQAAEELRRRDPVKRAAWVASLLVSGLVVWSGYLQVQLMAAMREVGRKEADWKKIEPDYKKVSQSLDKLADVERRLAALQSLATNRFLWATPLNALQYVMLKVDDLQITRLKTDQSYSITEGVKPSTNPAGSKPATSREKVLITIDGRDFSKRPGDQVFKLQEALTSDPWFKTNLQKVELTQLSPSQQTGADGRPFVFFTLDCQFSEKVR